MDKYNKPEDFDNLPDINYHLLLGDLGDYEVVRENGYMIKRLKKGKKSS
jgi:hypothetical protein